MSCTAWGMYAPKTSDGERDNAPRGGGLHHHVREGDNCMKILTDKRKEANHGPDA